MWTWLACLAVLFVIVAGANLIAQRIVPPDMGGFAYKAVAYFLIVAGLLVMGGVASMLNF